MDKSGHKTGGRQKGTKNKKYVFLPDLLDSKNLDWRTDIVRMLKRMPDYLRFKYYLEFMPYLVARLDSQQYKPSTPEDSKKSADELMAKIKALESSDTKRKDGSDKTSLDGR